MRIETFMLPDGKIIQVRLHLSSLDSEGTDQNVSTPENDVKQGATKGPGCAARGGYRRNRRGDWRFGDGDGEREGCRNWCWDRRAVGVATELITRGREVDLRPGSTFDVVFERPVPVD